MSSAEWDNRDRLGEGHSSASLVLSFNGASATGDAENVAAATGDPAVRSRIDGDGAVTGLGALGGALGNSVAVGSRVVDVATVARGSSVTMWLIVT